MANKAEFEVELIDDVTRPAKKAEGALARLKKDLGRFNKSAIGKASQELATFTKNAVTVGAVVGGALAGGLAAITVGMVDFSQRSRQAFSLLAKQGEIPEQLFQRSMDLAEGLGLNIKDTTKQIQKFRALQFSQDQAEALIKMGADMQALGANSEEVSRIFAQLGQIKAKDTLQTEELRTLAESGVSTQVVFAALAKQLGKTEDAVKSMISKGEITGSQALNAIGTAILFKTGTKEFGEAGKGFADATLGGMFNQMKAKIQRRFQSLSDAAAPAIEDLAKQIFGELNSFLDSSSGKAFFAGIADAMTSIAQGVKAAMPLIKQFMGGFSEGAADTFKELAGAAELFFGALGGKGRAGVIRSIGQTVGALTVLLGGLIVAFGSVVAAATLAANFLGRHLKGALETLSSVVGAIVFPFFDAFYNILAIIDSTSMSIGEKAIAIGRAIITGILQGIKALATAPVDAIMGIAKRSVDAAKSVLGIKSPSKVFEDIGKNTALGFSNGLLDLPTQNIIHSTLGNDNGVTAPVRGNLSGAAQPSRQQATETGTRVTIGKLEVVVQGGGTPEQMEEQGRAAMRGAFRELHEYFDDLTIEQAV